MGAKGRVSAALLAAALLSLMSAAVVAIVPFDKLPSILLLLFMLELKFGILLLLVPADAPPILWRLSELLKLLEPDSNVPPM